MSDVSVTIIYEDVVYPEREIEVEENPVEVNIF